MSNKEKSKKTTAKKNTTKKAFHANCLEMNGPINPVIASTVSIEISTKKNTKGKKIVYLWNSQEINGDVDVETKGGLSDGLISFFSKIGPIVISLYPERVGGDVSDFIFEARNAGPKDPIKIKIPKSGKKGDAYKYSVALFDGSEVVSADPRIRIAN